MSLDTFVDFLVHILHCSLAFELQQIAPTDWGQGLARGSGDDKSIHNQLHSDDSILCSRSSTTGAHSRLSRAETPTWLFE